MRTILRYAVIVIVLTSVFFAAYTVLATIDDNDRWRDCEIDGGTATCTFIQHTARRGGESIIEASCEPPVLRENGGYKHVCKFTVDYLSHIIEE